MKLIKLTSINNTGSIYVNVECIGHMCEVKDKVEYGGKVTVEKHTVVGVVTHNNGGFRVKETVKDIMKIIENVNG
jgi:hypothetical protein